MRYTKTELAKKTGIARQTLRRWHNTKRLEPYVDSKGNFYYTTDHLKLIQNNFNMPTCGKLIIFENKWIDFSNVPLVRFKDKIDWKKAAENKSIVKYEYNGINGSFYIDDVEGNKITIVVNKEIHTISTDSLTKCNLAFLTNTFTSEYRYEIGENIKNKIFNITILKRWRDKDDNKKMYLYHCNDCKHDFEVEEYRITKCISICPGCSNTILLSGFNDVKQTNPWMLKYLPDDVDATQLTYGSNKSFYMKCPDCGRLSNKKISIKTLFRTHSIGCVCGDGISYPNKFMYDVLKQLKNQKQLIIFEREWSPEWLGRYRFDFFVELNDHIKLIIEVDGKLGHGNTSIDKKDTPEVTRARDEQKESLARENGYENIIRINAFQSDRNYLSENIQQELNDFFDFSKIDWSLSDEFATHNLVKTVCEYYSEHNSITMQDLALEFDISKDTARSYVYQGEKIGWCKYNKALLKENRAKGSRCGAKASCKAVDCYDLEHKYIKRFTSIKEAANFAGRSTTAIANCCKGNVKKSGGYIWKYAKSVEK